MRLRYLIRFILLAVGFALTTGGLLAWQQVEFEMQQVWPMADELTAHPIYVIVLGMALIPPTLWEIFVLENQTNRDT